METTVKASSLRWKILRQALLRKPTGADSQSEIGVKKITRKTTQGFNLIPSHIANDPSSRSGDVTVCYTLPGDSAPKLHLTQRVVDRAELSLSDFEICNEYNIDNTGLVCQWPSEEVLAYFCLTHADMFRSKRVLELGSGYGLGGLVIAAVTEASEVVISDGNPQVVNYIQHNIDANSKAFGGTRVKSMMLHWSQNEISTISSEFDLIVASDCTFFKEFHNGLAEILKFLLGKVQSSEAIFFSPKRGDSLDKFLETIKECGLRFSITENYDAEIWKHHEEFLDGDGSWPSYQKDHCYPLLIRITAHRKEEGLDEECKDDMSWIKSKAFLKINMSKKMDYESSLKMDRSHDQDVKLEGNHRHRAAIWNLLALAFLALFAYLVSNRNEREDEPFRIAITD